MADLVTDSRIRSQRYFGGSLMVVVSKDQQGLAKIRNRTSLLDRLLPRGVLRLPLEIVISVVGRVRRRNVRFRSDCRLSGQNSIFGVTSG
jgi:hypothetical protein